MCREWLSASTLVIALLAIGCRFLSHGPDELVLPQRAERLLVFAPHPDDEALAAGGLIQRTIAAGGSAHVVLMTSGDAFSEGVKSAEDTANPTPRDFRDYGSLRERETIAGMQRVGVGRAEIKFLGFPDDGLCLIASKYLSSRKKPFKSPYTGREEPPAAEQVIRGVTYRGVDVRREIEAILTANDSTLIALPHPEDHHPEHCATSIFVREALAALAAGHPSRPAPRVLYYLVHHHGWPDLDEDPRAPLRPPADFRGEGQWHSLTLTVTEAAAKRRALDAYASQMEVMPRFLKAFARPNELFVEGRITSPPECWCDETHVATEGPPERYRRRLGGRR